MNPVFEVNFKLEYEENEVLVVQSDQILTNWETRLVRAIRVCIVGLLPFSYDYYTSV